PRHFGSLSAAGAGTAHQRSRPLQGCQPAPRVAEGNQTVQGHGPEAAEGLSLVHHRTRDASDAACSRCPPPQVWPDANEAGHTAVRAYPEREALRGITGSDRAAVNSLYSIRNSTSKRSDYTQRLRLV